MAAELQAARPGFRMYYAKGLALYAQSIADRINQRNNGSVLDAPEAPPLKVIDLEAEQLGEKQKFVRHRLPGSIG